MKKYLVYIESVGDPMTGEGPAAHVPNLPGASARGKTVAEAKEKVREAVTEYLAENGYAFVQVVPRGNRSFDANTIDVTYQVDEGARVCFADLDGGGVAMLADLLHVDAQVGDAHLEAALIHIADIVTHCAQESKDPLGSPFYDPYGALLDSDLNAEEISAAAIEVAHPKALSLTGISQRDIVDTIGKSASAFNQVLDLLYPMAWETLR